MEIELDFNDTYTISQHLNHAAKGFEDAKVDLDKPHPQEKVRTLEARVKFLEEAFQSAEEAILSAVMMDFPPTGDERDTFLAQLENARELAARQPEPFERNEREVALLTHLNGEMDAQAARARDLAIKFECSEGATLLDVELD
jgi:hypothetical protein